MTGKAKQDLTVDMEVRVRARVSKLMKDRDAFIVTAKEKVAKMQNDLNSYVAQSNETLAGYNATIDELNALLGNDAGKLIEETVRERAEGTRAE